MPRRSRHLGSDLCITFPRSRPPLSCFSLCLVPVTPSDEHVMPPHEILSLLPNYLRHRKELLAPRVEESEGLYFGPPGGGPRRSTHERAGVTASLADGRGRGETGL